MAGTSWDPKDPDEVLDYGIDWSALLNGDTIATSTWIVPDGITKDSDTNTTTTTTIWLSGGLVADKRYTLTNRITTTEGRTRDQSVKLPMKNK